MAEMVSESGSNVSGPVSDPPKHPPKRRRIIDPSSITTVPVYSNKVNRSLNLKPVTFKQTSLTDEEKRCPLWCPSPPRTVKQPICIDLSGSEEESEHREQQEILRSPSPPPPPCSPPVKQSRRANQKIREINRKLDAIGSLMCLSPERQEEPVIEYRNSPSPVNDYDDDDDIIIIPSGSKQKRRPLNTESREISLKFRCRTELYKIPILSTAPLSKAVEQLAIKLNVPPSQILLLKKDVELPFYSSVNELGLGIADIIDCVVVTENKQKDDDRGDIITVRLQGKEKGSVQEYSLQKNAPLGSILSQYVSGLAASVRRKVKFLFDGSKVTHNQTPADLDMEDGDVIEVWA
ncbi:NFATC2-interacting protein [Xyrauchen texanus]|uniref:NFATC2-interacting protein n=1 Tax=Xyrauchen texanus TaxID=154827 RepID=UPI002241F45C|nr:NFATC2-interacting protein [Xyrauchen texanus]